MLGGDAALALDRGPCLELIAAPPHGILPLLDHQCRAPKGSDAAFAEAVNSTHADSALLLVPRLSRTCKHDAASAFVVVHFAGEVLYESRAFLNANHDSLHAAGGSAAAWLATSSRPCIAALFNGRERRPVLQRSRSTFASVGHTFATDLGSLLTTLQNANTVHYVRCLKHSSSTTHHLLHTTHYLPLLATDS
jgi:myosin heavy subunit